MFGHEIPSCPNIYPRPNMPKHLRPRSKNVRPNMPKHVQTCPNILRTKREKMPKWARETPISMDKGPCHLPKWARELAICHGQGNLPLPWAKGRLPWTRTLAMDKRTLAMDKRRLPRTRTAAGHRFRRRRRKNSPTCSPGRWASFPGALLRLRPLVKELRAFQNSGKNRHFPFSTFCKSNAAFG